MHSTTNDEALEQFQIHLLQVLYQYNDAEIIYEQLISSPSTEPFESWVSQMDSCMIEVAAELVKKWSVIGDLT